MFEDGAGIGERRRLESQLVYAPGPAAANEARPLQAFDVARNDVERRVELRRQLRHPPIPARQQLQQPASRRVRQGDKREIDRAWIFIHMDE